MPSCAQTLHRSARRNTPHRSTVQYIFFERTFCQHVRSAADASACPQLANPPTHAALIYRRQVLNCHCCAVAEGLRTSLGFGRPQQRRQPAGTQRYRGLMAGRVFPLILACLLMKARARRSLEPIRAQVNPCGR